jgi:hypothetical protein
MLGETFVGYIYQACFSTYAMPVFDISTAHSCVDMYECATCPETVCLSTCKWDEHIDPDTKECGECLDECSDGCVRGTDCRLCLELLCDDCPIWSTPTDTVECGTCVPGTETDASNACQCETDKQFYELTEECGTCPDECESCNRTDNCTACLDGYYLDTANDPQVCPPCAAQCATCTDSTNTTCETCKDGFFTLPHTTICEDYCPTLT